MAYAERKDILTKIAADRSSKVLLYATSDRPGMEAKVFGDAFDYFVNHLDTLWPTERLTLVLHTNGGDGLAAWRIVNLLLSFCDELEVIVISKALSAGTLICLGAQRIIMTKQASLGPIDPSLTSPLSPQVPDAPGQRVPVSTEVVQGYIDLAKDELGIRDPAALAHVLSELSTKVHPLVLGQIFRSRNQIRSLAEQLLSKSGVLSAKRKRLVDFLCSESGSHDRMINRREAVDFGLNIEKPSQALYDLLKELYEDFVNTMELRSRFDPNLILAGQAQATYACERVILESVEGGSARYLSEGTISTLQVPQASPAGTIMVTATQHTTTFEGWRTTP